MAFNNFYFSGQGKVYVAPRNSSGTSLAYIEVGNVPALTVQLETDVVEHKESTTGSRLLDYRLVRENRARVTMTLENFTKKNLMMMMYGTESTTTNTTSVTGEALVPSGHTLAAGDIFFTKFPNITSLTLTPASGTLTAGTNYTVDLATGQITMVGAQTATSPVTAAYTAAAYESVQLFKAANPERSLRFSGLNTAATNAPVTVELYRIIFDPTANINLINDELAQFELTGSVLFDSTKNADATLGGFGRIIA
mgnify:CR=1 FL=1